MESLWDSSRDHALRDGVDLRPRGEHTHDAHAPADGRENEEQSEEAEGHG